MSDINDLDAVVHALGIEDSHVTPAEAVAALHAEIARLSRSQSATVWRPITEEIRHPVLVTNNIKARDARGHMSHLWVARLVQRAEPQEHMLDEGWICFVGWQKVIGLTHYAEINPPATEAPDPGYDECDIQAAMAGNRLL